MDQVQGSSKSIQIQRNKQKVTFTEEVGRKTVKIELKTEENKVGEEKTTTNSSNGENKQKEALVHMETTSREITNKENNQQHSSVTNNNTACKEKLVSTANAAQDIIDDGVAKYYQHNRREHARGLVKLKE